MKSTPSSTARVTKQRRKARGPKCGRPNLLGSFVELGELVFVGRDKLLQRHAAESPVDPAVLFQFFLEPALGKFPVFGFETFPNHFSKSACHSLGRPHNKFRLMNTDMSFRRLCETAPLVWVWSSLPCATTDSMIEGQYRRGNFSSSCIHPNSLAANRKRA